MNENLTWLDEYHKGSRYGLKGKIIEKKMSPLQEIIVLETNEYGRALMLDGCWMTSDKEEKYYHECLVHPALSSLQEISNILIIGGGDGGTARECLKYKQVENIDLVEIDNEVINISKKYLTKINNKVWLDKRLKIHIDDGFKWVKNMTDDYYDVILIDGSDPSGFSKGVYSKDFYKECKRILNNKGIIATQSESPESFQEQHLNIIRSIKETFTQVQTMYSFVPFYPSGIWSWTFASDNKDEFLKGKNKEIDLIKQSCDIWNLNYQSGALKMMPNKIYKALLEEGKSK
ncbi:MAG: polyamine aminopropyltransferase [Prochlorococcus sp. SP3034]|nr:polyamine aminopropyltransferase [Prochlorococcus sp. SP3034]